MSKTFRRRGCRHCRVICDITFRQYGFADAIPMIASLSTFRVPPLAEFFGTPTPQVCLVCGLPFSRVSWSLPVVS